MARAWHVAALFGALTALVGEAAALPECVKVRTSAPYRNLGYDHLVHITNGCDVKMTCRVTTNVNPSPIVTDVPSKASVEVITFRGSPAREFQANVSCSADR